MRWNIIIIKFFFSPLAPFLQISFNFKETHQSHWAWKRDGMNECEGKYYPKLWKITSSVTEYNILIRGNSQNVLLAGGWRWGSSACDHPLLRWGFPSTFLPIHILIWRYNTWRLELLQNEIVIFIQHRRYLPTPCITQPTLIPIEMKTI